MKAAYPVIITKDEDEYLVDVPDFDIQTEGSDIPDAIEMARDAIGLRGITEEDCNRAIRTASKSEDIDISKGAFSDVGKGFITLVDVDFDEYRKKNDTRMIRKNVTIPSWMDVRAKKEHVNVSRVLQDALMARFS